MVLLRSVLITLPAAVAVLLVEIAVAPAAAPTHDVVVQNEKVSTSHRSATPAWGHAVRQELVAMLRAADREGLDPRDYAVDRIKVQPGRDKTEGEQDRILTQAVARYATHRRLGRVDPRTAGQDWQHAGQAFDAAVYVATLAGTDLDQLAMLSPPHAGYERLRETLARYRGLRKSGGWTSVPHGPLIEPGGTDDRIPAVRERLRTTGDYADGAAGPTYDDGLVAAVAAFQVRHGLSADGIIGRQTISAMNVPVEARIEQIILNMERWRWLPRALEPDHIAVNIAAAHLDLVEDGKPTLSMRVIVGTPKHKTPSFRASIGSVTLNPVWNVPYSIASNEILPALKRHPDYLVANRLRIVNAFPSGSPQEEGLGIDWSRYDHFPYQLRQMSGPENSLGRIKFNMPNGNSVFLHDTPSRQLFDTARRTYSHGCVRLAQPLLLASRIMGRPETTQEMLQNLIDTGVTDSLRLAKAWPVYLFYFTAWIDDAGSVQFRDDVYGYDELLSAAIRRADGAKAAPPAAN